MSPPVPETPEPRFFSLEEANRMLPLVGRIAADIAAEYGGLAPMASAFGALADHDRRTGVGRGMRAEIAEREERIDALVAELQELGCRFKGYQEGLVDWYSYYAGRPVFLCWRLGEAEIGWWHQVDAGFAGRQPILPSQRGSFRATAEP